MSKVQNIIPKYVESFFKSCEIDQKLNRYSFFLIRLDGVVLYHNNNDVITSSAKSSIGALLGGVWQASRALSEFIPNKENEEAFRLSFDSSSQGIYVLPINLFGEKFFLGLIYFGEVNPGAIKNKIRDLSVSFREYMERELKQAMTNKTQHQSSSKTGYLFKDITDAEVDALFSFDMRERG